MSASAIPALGEKLNSPVAYTVNPPERANVKEKTRRTAPLHVVKSLLDKLLDRPTDGGFAEWLIAKHGDKIRYMPEQREWRIYTGGRLMRDDANAVREYVKNAAQAIIDLIAREKSEKRQQAMLRLAHRYDTIDRIDKVLAFAASDERLVLRVTDCDRDPMLLNCTNGVVDLRDGRLLVHQPFQYLTKTTGIEYDPNATAPLFEAFLKRIMRSHHEVIPFIQRALGYALVGHNREHKFFILYGVGRNGKSTLVEVIISALGDYAQSSNPETWLRQSGGRGAEPEIARLPGVRMVTAAEITEGRSLDEARVKSIVAGDRTTTRTLYAKPFDFVPVCKLWISTNHAPQIRGGDEGMWRRVCLIPFDEIIELDEMDRDLPRKLREELPGILAWMVRGCLEYQRVGLDEPEIVRAKTSEYRSDSDVIAQFVDECCERVEDAREPSSALHHRYMEWARDRGDRNVFNANAFGRRLTDRGFRTEKIGGVAWRVGLRLRPRDAGDRWAASA